MDAVNIWKCTKHENMKGNEQEYLAFHVLVFSFDLLWSMI